MMYFIEQVILHSNELLSNPPPNDPSPVSIAMRIMFYFLRMLIQTAMTKKKALHVTHRDKRDV